MIFARCQPNLRKTLSSRQELEFDESSKAFPVSVTEIVGILLATGGMYFALIERASSGNSPVEKETSGGESSPKFLIPRSAVFQSAIFAGLAILGLSHSSCPELLPRSMLADGMYTATEPLEDSRQAM